MPRIWELARRAVHSGPRLAVEKGIGLAQRKWQHFCSLAHDQGYCSYDTPKDIPRGILQYVAAVPEVSRTDWPTVQTLARRYAEHRFDLLGSGWCRVFHGMQCSGVDGNRYQSGEAVKADTDGHWLSRRINRANLATAQRIWRAIEAPYRPIDWHLDFKSGYRWNEKTWHARTPFGHLPGVDIKVPWELARMQHLPQMAIAAGSATRLGEHALADTLRREFRNQILDFSACNPPRFGVNWRCAMDVGIRAANWLLAYDLFRAGGMAPCEPFDALFFDLISAHGQHLIENLEWQRLHRGNHYLADISGLLFVAAYLPCSPRVDAWLAFAVRQFTAEILRQFTPDGANFEASTSYHRLSAEMAVFGSALILGLGRDKRKALADYNHRYVRCQPGLEPAPIPTFGLPQSPDTSPLNPECFERLERMAEFSRDVTKPDGTVHQVGDNDSGRFFKLRPTFQAGTEQTTLDENHLDHRGLVAAIGAFVDRQDLLDFSGDNWPEIAVIRQLSRDQGRTVPTVSPMKFEAHRIEIPTSHSDVAEPVAIPLADSTEHRIELPPGATADIRAIAYPDFGLYIWRGPRLYLAVRCGPTGQEGNGGHAHNDQLAIELQVDGHDWLTDVGTYLYTANPVARNEYRSARTHFVPRVEPHREPGNLNLALFQLPDTTQSRCTHFDRHRFVGEHMGYGARVERTISLAKNLILISDSAEPPLRLCRDGFAIKPLPVSVGYGLRKAA